MAEERTCIHCGEPGDLRPYGPGGAPVCFDCGMKPANKKTTEDEFASLIGGPSPKILTSDGPVPFDPKTVTGDGD